MFSNPGLPGRRLAPVLLLLTALAASGCVPALTAASSTSSGQAAMERAVQSALVRAGLAQPGAALPADSARAPAALAAGPMLADVTQRGATVWVQTDRPASVAVEVSSLRRADGSPSPRQGAPTLITPAVPTAADGTASVEVFGLEPGATYSYTVLVDGVAVTRPYPTEIRAQPLWQHRTDPPETTLAFGSCFYGNDTPYDRPGDPYGGSTAIFESIRTAGAGGAAPDAMLWLGDNVYLREVDWWSPAGIGYRYAHARATPDLQALLAATPHYASWDDHDFGPNDSDRSYIHKDAALATFQRYWPNPTYGHGGVPGVFTQFQVGDAEVFLLDGRYHRAPNDAPLAERTMLGEEQLQWVLDALTASSAPLKVVVLGGQVLNPVDVFETYAAVAPAERQELLRQIQARGIDGVLFLSGDRHHTELIQIERAGTYPLYDFTSSPLTAGASTYALRPDSPEFENPARVPGTLVAGERTFGTLTLSGPRRDRTLTLRTFGVEGDLLWEQAMPLNSLRTPRD